MPTLFKDYAEERAAAYRAEITTWKDQPQDIEAMIRISKALSASTILNITHPKPLDLLKDQVAPDASSESQEAVQAAVLDKYAQLKEKAHLIMGAMLLIEDKSANPNEQTTRDVIKEKGTIPVEEEMSAQPNRHALAAHLMFQNKAQVGFGMLRAQMFSPKIEPIEKISDETAAKVMKIADASKGTSNSDDPALQFTQLWLKGKGEIRDAAIKALDSADPKAEMWKLYNQHAKVTAPTPA